MDNPPHHPEWQKIWDTIQSLRALAQDGEEIFPETLISLSESLQKLTENSSFTAPPPFLKELQQGLNDLIHTLTERRRELSKEIAHHGRQRLGLKTYLTS